LIIFLIILGFSRGIFLVLKERYITVQGGAAVYIKPNLAAETPNIHSQAEHGNYDYYAVFL